MSDGEPGRMTDAPPVVRLEVCPLAEAAYAFRGRGLGASKTSRDAGSTKPA